jgi:septal ring factor EnvC (AmiA/AmiB activator)
MMAWFTTAIGDDLNNNLERAAHQALPEFCECHLLGLASTAIALFPIQNEGTTAWSERLAAVGDLERSAYHMGWAFTACYTQHMSSMFQEVAVTGAYQRLCLEEYDHQVSAKNCLIKDIQKGNHELLQENHRLEARIKELNDELMRTYRSCNVKSDFLDDAHTRLKNTQDELVAAQGYIHHLEAELHEWDEQLEVSQTHAAELQDVVEHLQKLIPQEPEETAEPEEDPEEIEGMSGVEDN